MKQCSKCKEIKELSEFNKKTCTPSGLSYQCKTCTREAVTNSYNKKSAYYAKKSLNRKKEIRNEVRRIKESTPCKDCGKKYPYFIMEFDHLSKKSFNVASGMAGGYNKLLNEMKKCEIVCVLCHRLRTYNRKLTRTRGDNGIMCGFEPQE